MLAILSTSDTDLRSARAANATGTPVQWRYANPNRVPVDELDGFLDGTDLVVVRLLGGRRAWEEGLDHLLAGPRPVVVLTGEQAPDAELMPAGDLAELVQQLTEQMHTAAAELQFELAARLRDEISELKKELRQMIEATR